MIEVRGDDEERPGDYSVGYGKPPKEHQFKPGNKSSKGRKKGSRNLRTIAEEEFFAQIPHMENGRKRKTAALQLIIRRVRNDALNGNAKAIMLAIKLGMEFFPPAEEEGPEIDELNDVERAILDAVKRNFVIEDDDHE